MYPTYPMIFPWYHAYISDHPPKFVLAPPVSSAGDAIGAQDTCRWDFHGILKQFWPNYNTYFSGLTYIYFFLEQYYPCPGYGYQMLSVNCGQTEDLVRGTVGPVTACSSVDPGRSCDAGGSRNSVTGRTFEATRVKGRLAETG